MPLIRRSEPGAREEPGFLALALAPRVVRRGIFYAVVVGAILIVINHGDAILSGDLGAARLFKMGLTLLVPYAVSTLSSVSATRASGSQDSGRLRADGLRRSAR